MKILILSLLLGSNTFPDEGILNDFTKWMEGSWAGNGLDGFNQEIWTRTGDGTMMGMFCHSKKGEIIFYEFFKLDEKGLQLKHFNPDMTGWEDKEKYVTFKMIEAKKNSLVFEGMTIFRVSDNKMRVEVEIKREKSEIMIFDYERQIN